MFYSCSFRRDRMKTVKKGKGKFSAAIKKNNIKETSYLKFVF